MLCGAGTSVAGRRRPLRGAGRCWSAAGTPSTPPAVRKRSEDFWTEILFVREVKCAQLKIKRQ